MRTAVAAVLVLSLVLCGACSMGTAGMVGTKEDSGRVLVRFLGEDGKLGPPTWTEKVVKTDAEWRALLTPEQYQITRQAGTEPAFCGTFVASKKAGYYLCVCCGLPLFESGTKFESGTGWPSFFEPIAKENITDRTDLSHGMIRTEILCTLCGAHLGHVFNDGPRPTGKRYCLNSAALKFRPAHP